MAVPSTRGRGWWWGFPALAKLPGVGHLEQNTIVSLGHCKGSVAVPSLLCAGATIHPQLSKQRGWPGPDLLWPHGTCPSGGHAVPKDAQLSPSTRCTLAGGLQCSPSDGQPAIHLLGEQRAPGAALGAAQHEERRHCQVRPRGVPSPPRQQLCQGWAGCRAKHFLPPECSLPQAAAGGSGSRWGAAASRCTPGGHSLAPSPGTSPGASLCPGSSGGTTTLLLALLIPRKLWLMLDGQVSSYVPRRVAVYGGAPNRLQHLRTVLINE